MFKEYFIGLKNAFTLKFIGFLFSSQLFIKGTVYLVSTTTMLPIFKAMNMDAVHVQLYATLSMSPWSIKPLVGVLSDIITVRGYHKRYYLIQCTLVGMLSGIALTLIPHQLAYSMVIVVCYFGLHYQISILDLLSEGTYARIMKEHPETGTNIITLVNAFQTTGQLIGLLFIGPMSDAGLFLPIFIITAILCTVPLIPILLGWLPETKTGNACFSIDWSFISGNKFPLAVVALTGLSGPILALITIYVDHLIGIICAFIMLSLAIAGAYSVFPMLIGNVALYLVLIKIGKPSLGSAMDFFYTANHACVPNGPAFDFGYYITYTGIVSAIMSIVSIFIYQRFMSKWRYRSVLIFTSCLVGFVGLSDLVMVLRWNIAIGIPDKVFYIFGESIFENIVSMLFWIPSSSIIAKVCPKKMEATTYAFLAGISNFGGMTSNMLGAIIFKSAGIKTTLGECNFESLWWLVFVFHTITPLIFGVGASFLIPNKRQTEDLLSEKTRDLTQEFNLEDTSDLQ